MLPTREYSVRDFNGWYDREESVRDEKLGGTLLGAWFMMCVWALVSTAWYSSVHFLSVYCAPRARKESAQTKGYARAFGHPET